MEENKRTDSGYTGEYGNPVEHNDAPQVETENAAAYSETAQSASEQGASAQAEQSSTYSYSYKNGEGTSTHSGDYYGGGAVMANCIFVSTMSRQKLAWQSLSEIALRFVQKCKTSQEDMRFI